MKLELVDEATTDLGTDMARWESRSRKYARRGDTRVVWFEVDQLEGIVTSRDVLDPPRSCLVKFFFVKS